MVHSQWVNFTVLKLYSNKAVAGVESEGEKGIRREKGESNYPTIAMGVPKKEKAG